MTTTLSPASAEAYNRYIDLALLADRTADEESDYIDAGIAHFEAELARLGSDRSTASSTTPVQTDLTAREVAAQLRMAKSDGEPTEAAYRIISQIGYRVGREWRVQISALDAYKAKGGNR
jgi:hypothetical protein